MAHFQRILEQVYCRPWLITHTAHASIRNLLDTRLASTYKLDDGLSLKDFFPQRETAQVDNAGIGHVHIQGVIGKGLSKVEKSCGAVSVEDLQSEIASVAGKAKGVMLHISSPGGTVVGTPETADLISQVAQAMPVVAYTDELIASAAYYMAAGATEIYSTKSAHVGSIGVYIPWIDMSAYYDKMGVKFQAITNKEGDLKAIGFDSKLTDVQKAYLEGEVAAIYEDFKTHILNNRNVSADAMRGQTLFGQASLNANLVDGHMSRQEAYNRLLTLTGKAKR
jgi:protease-4